MSSTQIIIILKIFKDFFACKIVFDANHHYPENIKRFFRLQKCLRRKSSLTWNYSKTFSPAKLPSPQIIIIVKIFKDLSPAKLSQPQTNNILEIFKDFFACKMVFDANHHYPENIQKLFACNIVLVANNHYHGNIQRFFSCKIVLAANHHHPENIQKLFRLQKCLRHKSWLSWKYSKTYSPAKLS